MILYCLSKKVTIDKGKFFNYCVKQKCNKYRLFRTETRMINYQNRLDRMANAFH
jgi:hypothetical protein